MIAYKLHRFVDEKIVRILPAGLLREPLCSLKRADAIVITRTNQVSQAQLNDIENRLLSINPDLTIAKAMHAPVCAKTDSESQIELEQLKGKKVVLVEFPRQQIYSLGFLTSELQPEIAPNKKQKFFNIFIPTAPNPTSGYFVIAPEEDLIIVDLTRQEAMAMIISGGIIQPERFTKKDT